MGLDIYLEWENQTEEERSARYTGFSTNGAVGYLRSSYNEAGFNHWAKANLGVDGWYYIFDPDNHTDTREEDGEQVDVIIPDWDDAEVRAKALIEQARAIPDKYVAVTMGPNMFASKLPFTDERAALDGFREQAAQRARGAGSGFESYSNASGYYFFGATPLQVRAVTWIPNKFQGTAFATPMPETVLICEEKDPHGYYIGALEECLKFIALGREKKGWLHWSG